MARLGRAFPIQVRSTAAVATVGAISGSAAVTQDDQISTASGTFTPPNVTGSAATTQDDQTSAAAGSTVSGTAAITQADQTSTAAGSSVTGSSATTQADQTSTATGSLVSYILNDDFSGSSLTTPVWTAYERISDQVNNEVNAVLRRNVRVSGGSLLIDSKFEDCTIGDSEQAPDLMHYTSGQIGQVTAPFQYGIVEVRAKLPGGTGLWPCIWMLGFEWQPSQPTTANISGSNWPVDGWCEIDIAEFMFNHRSDVNTSLHWQSAGAIEERPLPFDATSRFMVYRLDWTPTSLTWKVDGEDGNGFQTLRTVTGAAGTDIPDVPMYLIIHTAIGGNGGGTPSSGTFPQTFEVDYARVLRTADTTEPITTAYAAITQADQTSTATGSHTATGTAAVTQDSQTSTANGSLGVAGTSTATQADQTSSAVGSSVTGASAIQQDDQTSTAAGAHGVTGTSSQTQDDQTSTASGTANPPGTSGSVAVTQDDQTSAASGAHGVAGASTAVEGDDTSAATGSSVTGSSATTQDDQTCSATGTHSSATVSGTAAITQDDQTSSAVGWFLVTGALAAAQADQTSTASGTVGIFVTPDERRTRFTAEDRTTRYAAVNRTVEV